MPSTPSRLKPKPSWQFEAIGTQWSVETDTPLGDEVRARLTARIDEFDRTYSRFRDDSLVARLARQAGEYQFPQDAAELLGLYRELYDATDGAVTPLIGVQLREAGYDKSYSLKSGEVHDVPAWDDVMRWNGQTVATTQLVELDVGAAGKGLLVDIVSRVLEEQGIRNYVVDASGDVRQRGSREEVIGLENPYDPSSVIGIAKVQNASLCASATNRRKWGEGMHHVFDPRTRSPTRDVVATWVVAENTMLADGLATALFFVDGKVLQKHWKFEYVRLMRNGHLAHSRGFVGELYI